MERTRMGHAIVSPGWRLTWRGLAHVWCTLQITGADMPVLQDLRQTSSHWRLEEGADDLMRILKNRGGTGDEPENSMFNRRTPHTYSSAAVTAASLLGLGADFRVVARRP
jgi:hypothetical protein